jgi:hypothetical protein
MTMRQDNILLEFGVNVWLPACHGVGSTGCCEAEPYRAPSWSWARVDGNIVFTVLERLSKQHYGKLSETFWNHDEEWESRYGLKILKCELTTLSGGSEYM